MARFHAELPLVDGVAAQLRREVGGLLEFDEMVSFGQEGLLTAARRYDPDRGVPFRKYAYHRIRGAILDGMRLHAPLSRRNHEKVKALQSANLIASGFFEDTAAAIAGGITSDSADERLADHLAVLATAMALGLEGNDLQQDGQRVTVASDRTDSKAEQDELMKIVHAELANLSDQEALFIRRHFFRDENIEDIASDMGLSKSWGSRVLSRGISKLSKRLQALA
jgi:RNA polymerase sigma factor for flagellar operon FliA